MKKIITSLSIAVLVALGALSLSSSFFSDTETSTNNILGAGSFDLLLDGQDNTEGIVSFEDLKPGDNYIEEKILKIVDNPGYVWLHLKDVETSQGEQTEPEQLEEDGTPKHDINNYLTYDLSVEGDTLISVDDEVGFNDVVSCWIPLGEIAGGVDVSVNQSFHLNEDVTNWAQGDKMSFAEEFYAEQSRNNPNPVGPESQSGRVWLEDSKVCAITGAAEDPNNPWLGLIEYAGYPSGYQFWFTPTSNGGPYEANHDYHNTYKYEVDDTSLWCGPVNIPNREPYNLAGVAGEQAYYKIFDETDNTQICP